VNVTVVFAAPGVQDIVPLVLPEGATVAHAVARSGLLQAYALDPAALGFALHGKRCTAGAALADGDRVELTRSLIADPKDARRRRAKAALLPKPAPKVKRHR
jgi:putative ubiquitin-RnfH superfamily antitoxin RatB of RatAB toxin-antitoxin module